MDADAKVKLWIDFLESDWEAETGFLRLVHRGTFDRDRGNQLLEELRKMELPDDGPQDRMLERRFVSAVWLIPLYLEWNKRSAAPGQQAEHYKQLSAQICTEVMRIMK